VSAPCDRAARRLRCRPRDWRAAFASARHVPGKPRGGSAKSRLASSPNACWTCGAPPCGRARPSASCSCARCSCESCSCARDPAASCLVPGLPNRASVCSVSLPRPSPVCTNARAPR
jgi:hypothetical protein